MASYSTAFAASFWARTRVEPNGCRVWTKALDSGGYGHVGLNRKAHKAHRIAWELANGRPVPDGLDVIHSCDNPPCCEPTHLSPETVSENMKQMYARGRRQPTRLPGESNPFAKLTNADIDAIRTRYAAGNVLQKELAAEYGISSAHMSRIVHRKQRTDSVQEIPLPFNPRSQRWANGRGNAVFRERP